MPEALHESNDYSSQLKQYEIFANKTFQSKKAIIEGRLSPWCGILPKSIVLNRDIVTASDAQSVELSILNTLASDYSPGVRTCFQPQIPNSPWVMGIKNKNEVKNFMKTTYPKWISMPNISELIVMHNPPSLNPNSPELSKQHFVLRLWRNERDIKIEARLGTTQLRDLEAHTSQSDIISININHQSLGFGNTEIRFGDHYSRDNVINKISISHDKLWKNDLDPKSVTPHYFNTVNQIVKKVESLIVDPYIKLNSRLDAFTDIGLEISEWQGNSNANGDINWMKIYGFRGSQDDTNWQKFRRS